MQDVIRRRAADYVHRTIQGERPGDLPVERSARWRLSVILETAKAIGVMIPPMVLGRADEVIDLPLPLVAHSDEVPCSPTCQLSGVDRKFPAAVLIDANDPKEKSTSSPSAFARGPQVTRLLQTGNAAARVHYPCGRCGHRVPARLSDTAIPSAATRSPTTMAANRITSGVLDWTILAANGDELGTNSER
jgi:hypothetical protein